MKNVSLSVAIVGTGPAALMAADVLSSSTHRVSIFEKRKSLGRKLLIAGSSGLNITNDLPVEEFARHYSGPPELWQHALKGFTPQDWIQFIEKLGSPTFKGTSGRYFVEDMKASGVLKKWKSRLDERGVQFYFDSECVDFEVLSESKKISLTFQNGKNDRFDAIFFALGGGSYETKEDPLRWPEVFKRKGIAFEKFTPSNVGLKVDWSKEFLKEAEGKPLKNILLTSKKGSRRGELVITSYGIEGTPVYFVGQEGNVQIDLKPDLSLEQLISKCRAVRENLSPMRRVKKQLNLSDAALALLFHEADHDSKNAIETLCRMIKSFPITLTGKQPLAEAISSAGGLSLNEIDSSFMFKRFPGVFAGGEMLDWDAPTGGFLIQGCISQGKAIGNSILRFLA